MTEITAEGAFAFGALFFIAIGLVVVRVVVDRHR